MSPVTQFEDPQYLEAVYAALFAQLISATFPSGITLNTTARVVVPPDNVPVTDQPALILVQGPFHAEQKQVFGPTKWIFTAVVAIYLQADTSVINTRTVAAGSPLPITIVNQIVWAITQILGNTTPPYSKQTLGGLVYHAWIEGEILAETQESQMVITIPINILAGPVG